MNESQMDSPQEERDVIARLIDVAGPRVSAPDAVTGRLRAAVYAEWQRNVRARRVRRRILFVALPATAVVALAVTVSLWPRQDGPVAPRGLPSAGTIVARVETSTGRGFSVLDGQTSQWTALSAGGSVQAGAALQTGRDNRAALRLTNGVSLRVGHATRVRLLSDVEVFLERGSVYVDNPPARAPAVSVSVHTRTGTVRELGTQFEVRLDESDLSVRVREGTVTLEREQRSDTASAGVELRVKAGQAVERRSIPVSGPEWAWAVDMAQPVTIEGRPLGEFLMWVTREMGWRLRFSDEHLAQTSAGIVLHGTIDGLTPGEALVSVLATCGLAYSTRDDILTIQEQGREMR